MRSAQRPRDAHDSQSASELRRLRQQSPTRGQVFGSAKKYPEFTRIDEDEADSREVLTRRDKQSRAAAKKYFDAFVPWTVP
jgi:hypothetical protein